MVQATAWHEPVTRSTVVRVRKHALAKRSLRKFRVVDSSVVHLQYELFLVGRTMSSTSIGLVFLFSFAVSQGIRDAYFGLLFQSVSLLFVATLAFGLSCAVFLIIAAIRKSSDLWCFVQAPVELLRLNIATAAAWLCFLYGLRFLEPAVVATLYNGIGPLVVLMIAGNGQAKSKTRISPLETVCYLGLAVTLVSLVVVVLAGGSGISTTHIVTQAAALVAVGIGGVMITLSYVITRRFTDAGVGSDMVMGVRFILTLVVAVVLEMLFTKTPFAHPGGSVVILAISAFALIVVPSYLVQLGVSRTSALTANIFRALGPVFVFSVQQLDGRVEFSGATLVCVVAFCAFTVVACVVRGRAESRCESP